MYLLFLASITTYVVTSPNPILMPQFYNCTTFFHWNNTINNNQSDIDRVIPFEKSERVNDISRIVLILTASLNLVWILVGGNFLILMKVRFCFSIPTYHISFFKAFIHFDIWTLDLPWAVILNCLTFR